MATPEEAFRAQRCWAKIAELTGGRSFTIDNPNDLADVATKIGIELRNQYVISATVPKNPDTIPANGRCLILNERIMIPVFRQRVPAAAEGDVCQDGVLCSFGIVGFCCIFLLS